MEVFVSYDTPWAPAILNNKSSSSMPPARRPSTRRSAASAAGQAPEGAASDLDSQSAAADSSTQVLASAGVTSSTAGNSLPGYGTNKDARVQLAGQLDPSAARGALDSLSSSGATVPSLLESQLSSLSPSLYTI